MNRNLISIKDLSVTEITTLFAMANKLKKNPMLKADALKGKTIALVFQKPSNRTKVSFEVGMFQLGGNSIYLGPDEVKLGVREAVKDVAKVLSKYVDGVVTRTYKHEDVAGMARHSSVPVINGLSDLLHPCQALSDLFTIYERFGNKKIKIAFVGDGNNVLHSLLLGCGMLGRDLYVATPKGYEPESHILSEARGYASKNNSKIELTNNAQECVKDADVIYTDVWVSMGQEKDRAERIRRFSGFQINQRLISLAKKGVLLMHCLPAHRGEEITDTLLDSEGSIVYEQAENRLHVQKAMLLKFLHKEGDHAK